MQSLFGRAATLLTACAVSFALITPALGVAQDDPATPASTDAVGVGVARVSLIDGSVSIQRGDDADALAAALNAPVLGGDYIVTGADSRGEIQLDGYSQLRLGDDVQMRFTHLDQTERSIQLAAGTIDVRLLDGAAGTTTIDTPSVTVKPQRGGSYRVTVTSDGQTLVTARGGDAQVDTPQGTHDVQPGTTLVAVGDATDPQIQTKTAVALDAFDQFNAQRDRLFARAQAQAGYVDPALDGLSDLAADGRWVDDGSYGNVWVPANVGPDWAPYRDGRWVWEEGYGWTWVAAEAWGWAPYHYGSWYHSPAYGWCWYPPRPHVVAIWRPALVAFIGFGAGGGFSLGFAGGAAFANIGWVPLAPFEPYHPWWSNRPRGPVVVNNITNITTVNNITNITVYKNAQFNAVTSVSSQHFIQGNFTHNAPVAAAQLRGAQVFRGAIPVVPTASNLRFTSSAAASPVAVEHGFANRAFAGSAVAVKRTPFTEQRVALATVTKATMTPLHFRDAVSTPVMHAEPNPAAGSSYAAHSLNESAGVAHPATRSAYAEHPATGSAWDRFNEHRNPQSAAAPRTTNAGIPTAGSSNIRGTEPAIPSYAAPHTSTDTYHAPARTAPSTSHAPATEAAPTYRAPAHTVPSEYHAPVHASEPDAYRAPAHPNPNAGHGEAAHPSSESVHRTPAPHGSPKSNEHHDSHERR